MKANIVTMTPEWAARLLERNTRNRPVKRNNLAKISRAMREGRFAFNGEAIQIDIHGDLLNGQHRLWACLETGVSFQTVLVEGLPPETQDTMDSGSHRGSADQLHLHGFSNATALAGVIRQVFGYLEGTGQGALVDASQMLEFIERHPDIGDIVSLSCRARSIVQPSILGAVLWLGSRTPANHFRLEAFVEPLEHGDGLSSGDPRLALRNNMINMRMRNNGRAPRPDYAMAVTTHAWNAFISGRNVQLVKAMVGDKKKYVQPPILGAPEPGSGLDVEAARPVKRSGKSTAPLQ